MRSIDAQSAREVLERFRETVRAEITDLIREAEGR